MRRDTNKEEIKEIEEFREDEDEGDVEEER